ncbi:hypothetical protein ACVBE9_00790 [Eionea flava]
MQEKTIDGLKTYVTSKGNEDANAHFVDSFFKDIFGNKFKKESEAEGADIYIEGQLVVELKTHQNDWVSGLYQAQHYSKKGLSFTNICVITHEFIGLWRTDKLPDFFKELSKGADPRKAPNFIGKQLAKKTKKAQQQQLLNSSLLLLSGFNDGLFQEQKADIRQLLHILKNLDSARLQVNPRNFIDVIYLMERFFDTPMKAIHAFYDICGYWDVTSSVIFVGDTNELQVLGRNRSSTSIPIEVAKRHQNGFKEFIEERYVFTNEGSGLTHDYYFSRFDEVISKLDAEYAKQHGIFFTSDYLSKFTSWFVHENFEKELSDNYIVFDPAGGSGNLVSSWRGNLKHKVISELQPDLLRTIERRLKLDDDHLGVYSVIPKTSEGKGLNFLDISGVDYYRYIENVFKKQNMVLDKPFAFFLNPPYKNTDENEAARDSTDSNYEIHRTIIEQAGNDAGKERYLAFLAQILNISVTQNNLDNSLYPLVMIFTPTSWLVPRPTYREFRTLFDQYFEYKAGYIVNSKSFFNVPGKWPLAFTVWKFTGYTEGQSNNITLKDYTHLTEKNLDVDWKASHTSIKSTIKDTIGKKKVSFSKDRTRIKDWCGQSMSDFKRSPSKKDKDLPIYGGLPLTDPRRNNKKTYGVSSSDFLGLMDNGTPVRIPRKKDVRFEGEPGRYPWFRFDTAFLDMNKVRCLNAPPDQKGYCAYDLETAKKFFLWFGLAKSLTGYYPLWANQFDIWAIQKDDPELISLCFALGFIENRSVVTKFEANNPLPNENEVFLDNPFSPNNKGSFWNTILVPYILSTEENGLAKEVVDKSNDVYLYLNKNICDGKVIEDVGLDSEPYFEFFRYKDFLGPNSGLIQLRKYSQLNGDTKLSTHLEDLDSLGRNIKSNISEIIVKKHCYFE